MADAMDVLVSKRRRDWLWNGGAAHPGQVHVRLERAGAPSRWVTLMALRVLDRYGEAYGRGGRVADRGGAPQLPSA